MTDQQTVIPPSRPQRPMMIKGLVPRLPERGHIKIGVKGEMMTSQRGNKFQPPQKLDHFRVTTLERGQDGNFLLDTAFHARYGERPTEIPVRLLYDDPSLNYPTRYACFIGRTLWCTGDGETATRLTERPDELKVAGKIAPREVSCPCHRQEATYAGQDRCKMNGSLSVLIEGMGGIGGVWRFRTTSYNSIVGILSSMAFLRSVTSGVLANIPLVLRVQPKQATNPTNPTQSVTIYVVSIEFAGELAELQQYAHQIALDRATTHMSITHIEAEARRILELPAPANAVLPGDNGDEVVEEFYPEQVDAPRTDAPPRPTREQFVSPQAPEAEQQPKKDTPVLSEAEEAELAALVTQGDAAAAEGIDAFTAFWNTQEAKAYRTELTPRLDAWRGIVKSEPNASTEPTQEEIYPFEIYDVTGVAVEKIDLDEAVESYRAFFIEGERQQGEAGLTTVWDNNQGFMQQLDERGQGALSKELSMEYGKAREAAANRAQAERERADQNQVMEQDQREQNGEPPFAQTDTAPANTGVSNASTAKGRAPSGDGTGPTATTPASPSDLLGGTPATDLTVPLPRKKTLAPGDLDYFARQLHALIAEGPVDTPRLTRIRLANDVGLAALKAGSTILYDEAMAALYRKP